MRLGFCTKELLDHGPTTDSSSTGPVPSAPVIRMEEEIEASASDESAVVDHGCSLYVRGIAREVQEHEILALFSSTARAHEGHIDDNEGGSTYCHICGPVQVDWSQRKTRGVCWVIFAIPTTARRCERTLHQTSFHGVKLSVREETRGTRQGTSRKSAKPTHSTIVREVQPVVRGGAQQCRDKGGLTRRFPSQPHSYSAGSLVVGALEYPFPRGLYLVRLLNCIALKSPSDPLARMLADSTMGNKQAKELTECMACLDATRRGLVMLGIDPDIGGQSVQVFVLGAGKKPLCSAAMCLSLPSSWRFVAIDPILECHRRELGAYADRISIVRCLSQDFKLPKLQEDITRPAVVITVACHSHAPLQEFWDRCKVHYAGIPQLCVAIPCCSDFNYLPASDELFQFEDFEMYSPKRRIHLYADPLPPTL